MAEKEEEIKEAIDALEEISRDEEKERIAELRQKYIMDRESEMRTAREIGLEEGRKKGRKEGINKRNIEIVRKMLDEKIEIKTIEKITGLTRKDIESIKGK